MSEGHLPFSNHDLEVLETALVDFMRVLNDAATHETKPDINALPIEVEALSVQSLIHLSYYVALVQHGSIHQNEHLRKGLTYETVMRRVNEANIKGLGATIKNEEIVEFVRCMNYLTAMGFLYEAFPKKAH